MDGRTGRNPTPPGALRPAQLGIVLVGRVLLSHIGATVVDLADRGFLSLEVTGDDNPGWRLTVLDGKPGELLGYERAPLRGVPDDIARGVRGQPVANLLSGAQLRESFCKLLGHDQERHQHLELAG